MQLSKSTILVVEDEGIVALDLQNRLGRLGYAVVAKVDTGQDAVTKAQELKPDLILMDIQLPGDMDGIEAVAQIKRQSDMPVIYLTAFANEGTRARAAQTNPAAYLVKPFKDYDLRVALEAALNGQKR